MRLSLMPGPRRDLLDQPLASRAPRGRASRFRVLARPASGLRDLTKHHFSSTGVIVVSVSSLTTRKWNRVRRSCCQRMSRRARAS
jgi:hypothetical protein